MAEDHDPEDKTEDASERRITQALERGDVPRSSDLSGFLVVSAGAAAIVLTLAIHAREQAGMFGQMLATAGQRPLEHATGDAFGAMVGVLAPTFAVAGLAALGSGLVLHRLNFSLEPLAPKAQRISPGSGLKRLFGKENLVNFLRSLVKLTAVIAVVWLMLSGARDDIAQLSRLEPAAIVSRVAALTIKTAIAILVLYGAIALVDAVYQVFAWKNRLRMSLKEVKDENKDSEGNPEVRAKLRSLRQQRSRQRMMSSLPKATVLIVNPTHYAVALRYEKGMAAPVCVAKGVDELALRMREVAGTHRIPLVSNPPLARLLFATVEVDEPIPAEHYKPVAEIIGFVLRARKRQPRGGGSASARP